MRWSSVGIAFLIVLLAQISGADLVNGIVTRTERGERLTRFNNLQADGVYRPLELGPHHRLMAKLTPTRDIDGTLTVETNTFVELATGMHVWSGVEARWVEANEEIELLDDGARMKRGTYSVHFEGNVNEATGSIRYTTPEGERIRARVFCLAYSDVDKGVSILLARIKDAQGTVIGQNEVQYADSFDQVRADVRYTTTRSSFEQDVIIREQLPSPAEFGLRPETTRLEVWTEFLEAPVPQSSLTNLKRRSGAQEADQQLSFGVMRIGSGRAFSLGSDRQDAIPPGNHGEAIEVGKTWLNIDGRTFLVESVPFEEAAAKLRTLPPSEARVRHVAPDGTPSEVVASQGRHLPRPSGAVVAQRAPTTKAAVSMARIAQRSMVPGFVMDYVLVNTSQSNFVFAGDTTYLVTGPVTLTGNTIIEGGAVIKFGTNSSASLSLLSSTVQCLTGAYRPVIFTASDDNTVGELLPGSTGSPQPDSYGGCGLILGTGTITPLNSVLSNLSFRYLRSGISFAIAGTHVLSHSQFIKNGRAVVNSAGADLGLRNALITDCRDALDLGSGVVRAEHVTWSSINNLKLEPNGPIPTYVTNSLLVAVTNSGTFVSESNSVQASGVGVFQSVGSGAHYLTANSPLRNAGTLNISSSLKADFRERTTFPPTQIPDGWISVSDTVLGPNVPRDTDQPDLGYHYSVVDWAVATWSVGANLRLVITNGASITAYGTGGLRLNPGAKLEVVGSARQPIEIHRYQSVQEQPTSWGDVPGQTKYIFEPFSQSAVVPSASFRFVRFSALSPSISTYSIGIGPYDNLILDVRDCEFYGGLAYFRGVVGALHQVNNNLFDRSRLWLGGVGGQQQIVFQNNLMRGVFCNFRQTAGAATWTLRDNCFDGCTIAWNSFNNLLQSNHAYASTSFRLANSQQPSDVILSDPIAWASGGSGRYYLPTSSLLRNAGSRLASEAGLYHYTTSTTEAKEAATQLDIGYHYVSMGPQGSADTDLDGIADYVEDLNGNGAHDPGLGETNYSVSDGQAPNSNSLVIFTLLK